MTQLKLSTTQKIFKTLLGLALALAGAGHLTWARTEFLAQVPNWVPLEGDLVVVLSGVVEIVLGLALLFLTQKSAMVGLVTAMFFVAIFPGNISQYLNRVNAFGLNSDESRMIRLFFQPLLVWWALWSTGAWSEIRKRVRSSQK